MRPRIVALDVDAMEWTPLGPAGLYTKLLSRDPETGARTALQRMNPNDGYEAPTVAHFHTTYEEILGVGGRFTFDSRNWVLPGAYVFHPPRTVHGFKSQVIEDSLFLSRVGRDLDVNLVHEPRDNDLYVIEGDVPPRAPAAYSDAAGTLGWNMGTFLGQPAKICALSHDPETGEGSALVRVPPGWQTQAATRSDYLEIFVVNGQIEADDGEVVAGRAYYFYPPEERVSAFTAQGHTELYVNFGSAL